MNLSLSAKEELEALAAKGFNVSKLTELFESDLLSLRGANLPNTGVSFFKVDFVDIEDAGSKVTSKVTYYVSLKHVNIWFSIQRGVEDLGSECFCFAGNGFIESRKYLKFSDLVGDLINLFNLALQFEGVVWEQ